MDKAKYIVKTFSRTQRKDYENYLINAIWQKIDNINIRPVTQQYVKGEDNSYYLIDLFFPQLNMGVEIDEQHHKRNIDKDLHRQLAIEEKLSSIRDNKFFELIRMDATLPLPDLTKRVEEISEKIRKRVKEMNIQSWDTDVLPAHEIANRGYIQVDDYYRFKRIMDVANQLFFKNYRGYQQAAFNINMDDRVVKVWFPTISSEEKSEHKLWLNYLNEDWSEILEVNIREDDKVINHEIGELRIVFAKIKDSTGVFSYRYIGNFELTDVSEDNKLRKYSKISDRLYINYENEKVSL